MNQVSMGSVKESGFIFSLKKNTLSVLKIILGVFINETCYKTGRLRTRNSTVDSTDYGHPMKA